MDCNRCKELWYCKAKGIAIDVTTLDDIARNPLERVYVQGRQGCLKNSEKTKRGGKD